jgi:hypothetical protein
MPPWHFNLELCLVACRSNFFFVFLLLPNSFFQLS